MKLWITALALFIFAICLRLWNFGDAGRWWDEWWYVEKGYIFIELIKKGDFSNPFWYTHGSDHPPLTSFFYGLVSYWDIRSYSNTASYLLEASYLPQSVPIFNYDFIYTRMVSVIVSAVSVVLVFFIGARYFSHFVGMVAAIILAMLPHYLGLSQMVVLETWITLSFTACAFSYFVYLEKGETKFLILTGILAGLTMQIKQSNILIFALFFFVFLAWKIITKNKKISFNHLFYLTGIAIVTFVIVFPIPFFHLPEFINYSYDLWFKNGGLIPEQIFGIRMGARSFFYVMAMFVTTPVVILALSFFGIKISWSKRKTWIYAAIIIWFLVPFLMSFFHHRQHMVRYIIQFYAPLALLAAIGFEVLLKKFTKSTFLHYSFIAPLFVYLAIIINAITPYYLNYFNELVGGTKTVYEKQLFFLGWFGEGLKRPGMYIAEHADKNAKIGYALNPYLTLYKSPNLQYEEFDSRKKYDYVVVNYFNVIRMDFDRSILEKDYEIVYTERADGAEMAWVYKRRQ